MIILNKKILTVPHLFLDDGMIFINNFTKFGFSSMFMRYDGYFNLTSRLFAMISVSLARITNSVEVLTNSQES